MTTTDTLTDAQVAAKNSQNDANNLANSKNVGNTTTYGGTTIGADQMGKTTPLQTIPAPIDGTDHAGITSGVTQSVMDEYKALNDKQTAAEANQDTTGSSIIDSMNALLGKTSDTATANETAGVNSATSDVNKYTTQLADLNAQASSLNRAALAAPIQTQERNAGTGATSDAYAVENAGALRNNALQALSIGQQADIASAALTGSNIRLQAAKDKAQQIIDLKYNPLEAELAVKQKQYDLNKDALDSIDKKRTEALGVALDKEKTDLADKKEKDQANSDLILNAQTQGASSDLVAKAKAIADAGGTKLEVGSALGAYAGDYMGTQLKKAQIVEANANAAKTRADTATAALNNDPQNLAQQLVSGNLAPSELSKRATGTAAYNAVLKAADDYSMQTTGQHFNIAQADRNYKYATNVQTQNTLNYLGSLIGGVDPSGNITGGNLDALKTLSTAIPRTDFPAVNSVKWNAMLQTGNPDVVAYMANVTEVADQVAKVLQGGNGGGTSDAKLAQASQLFNKNFSVDQLNAVVDTLKPLLISRAKGLINNNPYLSDYAKNFGIDNAGLVGGMANNPYSQALNPSSAPVTATSIINSANGLYNIPSK